MRQKLNALIDRYLSSNSVYFYYIVCRRFKHSPQKGILFTDKMAEKKHEVKGSAVGSIPEIPVENTNTKTGRKNAYEDRLFEKLAEVSDSQDRKTIIHEWEPVGKGGQESAICEAKKRDLPHPPNETDECICEHYIEDNRYIYNRITEEYLIVGNCCIRKFQKRSGEKFSRHCADCKSAIKRNKSDLCKNCEQQYREKVQIIFGDDSVTIFPEENLVANEDVKLSHYKSQYERTINVYKQIKLVRTLRTEIYKIQQKIDKLLSSERKNILARIEKTILMHKIETENAERFKREISEKIERAKRAMAKKIERIKREKAEMKDKIELLEREKAEKIEQDKRDEDRREKLAEVYLLFQHRAERRREQLRKFNNINFET